jgi:hypothetical protein
MALSARLNQDRTRFEGNEADMRLRAGAITPAAGRILWRASLFAMVMAVMACSTARDTGADAPVTHRILNRGTGPIHCMINFGHWVTRDLGVIEKNGSKTVAFHRQPSDGALYILRDDGQRLMMIENIFCSAPDDSATSRGQVPLLAIQSGQSQFYSSICRAGEPVQCNEPKGD